MRSRNERVGASPADSWPRERMRSPSRVVVPGLPKSWHRQAKPTTRSSQASSTRSRANASMTWRVWIQTSPSGCHCGSWGQSIRASSSGKCRTQPASRRKSRPQRDLPALEQELAPLVEDTLGRQALERDRVRHSATVSAAGVELEARHQLHAAQDPQRVLDEALRGVAQQAALEVGAAAERVLELVRLEVDRHRVDGEVAAARRVRDRHRRIGGHLEVAVAGAGLALAPRHRDVDGMVAQLEDGERLADLVDAPLLFEQRSQPARLDRRTPRGRAPDRIGRPAQQDIADRATDQEGASAGIAHAADRSVAPGRGDSGRGCRDRRSSRLST